MVLRPDESAADSPTDDDAAQARRAREADEAKLAETLAAAARRSALGQVAAAEEPSGAALLSAIGGVRGIVETVLPGLMFLVVFTVTGEIVVSVLAPVVIALVFLVIRLVRREPVQGALAGIALLALNAGVALFTGRAEDNFITGFIINGGLAFIMIVSLIARWPLIGVVIGFLAGDHPQWRHNRLKRRVATIATILFATFPLIRLAVELPFYFAGNTAALATTKLILGVPLYAVVLWITWLLVRTAWTFGKVRAEGESNGDAAAPAAPQTP